MPHPPKLALLLDRSSTLHSCEESLLLWAPGFLRVADVGGQHTALGPLDTQVDTGVAAFIERHSLCREAGLTATPTAGGSRRC